jgi:hypothetical protein
MKKILIPVFWAITIVITSFVSNLMQKNARGKVISDVKGFLEKGNFSEADMVLLYAKHGNGPEQQMLFEGLRDTQALKKAKEQIAKQKRELELTRKVAESVEELKASYENSLAAHEKAKEASRKLIEAYKAKEAAMAESVVEKPANYNTAVPQSPPAYLPPIVKATDAEPAVPNWQMPTRNQALAIARKNAEAKWPNNYSMMEYELNNQMEAFDKLAQYQKQSWKPLMKTMINSAAKKWPQNYNMMVYEIENQIDAKERLDAAR